MNYGKGATSGVTGVALLPATGDNTVLFAVAISLIAVGVGVFVASFVMTRKSRANEA